MPTIKFTKECYISVWESENSDSDCVEEKVSAGTVVDVEFNKEHSSQYYKTIIFADRSISWDVPVDYFEIFDDKTYKLKELTSEQFNFIKLTIDFISKSDYNKNYIASKMNVSAKTITKVINELLENINSASEENNK